MSVSPWFDYNVYMANKLVQIQKADTAAGWDMVKLVKAFADAGFVGAEGAEQHFMQFGQNEDVAPNAFFNPTEYYRAKAAEVLDKDPKAVTDLDAADIQVAISKNGMNAWSHYKQFGSSEGVNPSNEFDTAAYMNAKMAALNNIEGGKQYTLPEVYAAFKAAGLSALEHFMLFGGNGSAGEVVQKYDPANPAIPTEFTVLEENKVNSGGSTGGETFRLTPGVDNIIGTSANNYIDASRTVLEGQVLNSLNNADRIDGGAGTDTLFVQMSENADITPASLKNVEILTVENTDANAHTLDLINGDGSIKTVNSSNAAAATTVNNIQGKIDALAISNTSTNTTIGIASGLTGTTDALALTLNNVTGGTVTVQPTGIGSGYETVNIVSAGSIANTSTLTDGSGNSLATVNVAGAQHLGLILSDTSVTKINAEGMTAGGLNVTVAAVNGQNMTITGSLANDVINMNGTFTADDTINGGEGIDTLVLTNAEAIAATRARTNVTKVETLRLSDITNGTNINVRNLGVDATGLQLFGGDHTGNVDVTYAAGIANFDRQNSTDNGAQTTTLTISGVATNDVLNVTLGTTAAGSTWNGNGAFTIHGAETVNITTQGGAAQIGGALTLDSTPAAEAVVVTGNQTLTITGVLSADSINASGMTGTAALILNGGAANRAIDITGTANNDTLFGGAAGDIINGGAGDDTIANVITGTAASARDVLTGGLGNDTFILRGDTASGTVATILSTTSFITDFTVGTAGATDILQLSATAANYSGVTTFHTGVAAAAAGATTIQTVAKDAAATGIHADADLLKFTTSVETQGKTLQTTFNDAIGSATITGITADSEVFFSIYDSTNGRMLVGVVDAGTSNAVIGTGDAVTLVGSITMTAEDYATFSNTQLSIAAA